MTFSCCVRSAQTWDSKRMQSVLLRCSSKTLWGEGAIDFSSTRITLDIAIVPLPIYVACLLWMNWIWLALSTWTPLQQRPEHLQVNKTIWNLHCKLFVYINKDQYAYNNYPKLMRRAKNQQASIKYKINNYKQALAKNFSIRPRHNRRQLVHAYIHTYSHLFTCAHTHVHKCRWLIKLYRFFTCQNCAKLLNICYFPVFNNTPRY